MNTIQAHLKAIKDYEPPNDMDGINKIYFLEVVEKPGWCKAGDTHRDVETRNNETLTNASLHRSRPAQYVVARKYNGKTFRDKAFHKFLESKGIERELNDNGSKSEWFKMSTETGLEMLGEFVEMPVRPVANFRKAQSYLIDKIQEAVDNGHQYINSGFCMRAGKTLISLKSSDNNSVMPVYIGKNLTSQASAERDNEKFGIVPEMITQSLHGVDELTDGELSKRTKQIIKNIDEANVVDRKLWFFVDEVDDSSHTRRSREIITPVVDHYRKLGKFFAIMPMSGTRAHRGHKILNDLNPDSIVDLSLEYYEMQILQPETTCRREFRHISFYSGDEDGLQNISDSMKNSDSGHKSLGTVVQKLLGTNNFDIDINPDFPNWFIKFATVGKANCNKLVDYLNRNHSTVEGQNYLYVAINGDYTKSKQAEEFCESIISGTDRTVVFITQGMATTSFSVPSIGTSVVFTDNEITADDTQALHRSCTWAFGKLSGNQIVVTTNASMDHTFDDIFEEEIKLAQTREEKIEIYRELLNTNSMAHFTVDGRSVRPIRVTEQNADKILDIRAKNQTRVSSMVHQLAELDEEVLDDIFELVDSKGQTSLKSYSAKGKKFDPFGDFFNERKKSRPKSDELSTKKKEEILRAFAENARLVPAVAQEQGITVEDFDLWDEVQVVESLFREVYATSDGFKDRIDTIYNLCVDDDYLAKNFIDNLV